MLDPVVFVPNQILEKPPFCSCSWGSGSGWGYCACGFLVGGGYPQPK